MDFDKKNLLYKLCIYFLGFKRKYRVERVRRGILAFIIVCIPFMGVANVVSKNYVDNHVAEVVEQKTETKVDVSAGTVQTLNGDYTVAGSFTVTGAFKVPTPPLPNPDAE